MQPCTEAGQVVILPINLTFEKMEETLKHCVIVSSCEKTQRFKGEGVVACPKTMECCCFGTIPG